MIGLLLSALDPFKMILLWGLKKIPLLLEIPALKDHLSVNMGNADGVPYDEVMAMLKSQEVLS